MRTLLLTLATLLLLACPKKDEPPAPAPPAPAPEAKPAEPAPKKVGPDIKLDCPAKTTQVAVAVVDGHQVYCRDLAGIASGPFVRVDAKGKTLYRRTFRAGDFEGEVKLYDDGKLTVTGRDQAGLLHDFTYAGDKESETFNRFMQGEVERAAMCETGESCVHVQGACPLGCDLAVNAKNKDRVQRWLKKFRGGCEYKCAPPTGKPACVAGACVISSH
jgi:hypothetical protein